MNYTRGGRGHSFRFSSISFQFLFKGCALGDEDAARALPPLPLWLDLANERLWRGDQALSLRPKTFALRRYLVEHPAQLLTKAALLEALWPEATASEVVLSVCIHELRQALGDVAKTPRFIETAHRRGYRFIGSLLTVRLSAPLTSVPFPPFPLAGRARMGRAASRSRHSTDGGPPAPLRHGRSRAGENDAHRRVPQGRGRARSALDRARTVPRPLRSRGKPIFPSWKPWSDCVGG